MGRREDLEDRYAGMDDEAVVSAARAGPQAYRADEWDVITNEVALRELPLTPDSDLPRPPTDAELNATLREANSRATRGIVLLISGVLLTVAAYSTRVPSHTSLVTWGVIVYGAIEIVRWQRRADRLNKILRGPVVPQ